MVSVAARYRETYQGPEALEQAVVDLIQVGSTGFAPGVRQLASRLLRAVPPGVSDKTAFRHAVNEAIARGAESPVGLRFANGEIPTSDDGALELAEVDPHPEVPEFVLAADAMRAFDALVAERRRADEFARAGVPLTRTVLLSGPPGVGKTLGAKWLAAELNVPLVTMSLAAVTSSFLGSSGRNVRSVFEYAKTGPCVLFLDEFDAIAKRRDDDADIGELKRLVNVILVELDRWPDRSLIVAATNHAQLLDPAVDRRFDQVIAMGLPSATERAALFSALSMGTEESLSDAEAQTYAALTNGLSGSDISRLFQGARRQALLSGTNTREELLRSLLWRAHSASEARDDLWFAAVIHLGLTNRAVAKAAGVSHPTVSAALKRAKARHDTSSVRT